MHYNKTWHNM